MTPLLLQKALNSFLEEKVAKEIKVKFINRDGVEKEINPSVFSGWLAKTSQNERNATEINAKEYAHLSTRITKVKDTEDSVSVEMRILIGIQSYDADQEENLNNSCCVGYTEVCNLIEKTRQELLKTRIIDNRYRIDVNIESHIYDEQSYPYWFGEMVTNWTLPVIKEEIDFDN